mmetsp:Transcript_43267/g.144106  ORF Transcript_43267/g.144106 Transcript_43267/m.144106 type:complete len:173 (+) Transcript_43267:1-519(+)
MGLMLGAAPAALIPRLGLRKSMQTGGVVYAAGLLAIAFARTPAALVSCVLFMTLGCIALPALVSFVAAQAPPAERGALLGALETLQDLCDTLAFSGYGRLFAASIEPPAKLPGAVFLVAAALLSAATVATSMHARLHAIGRHKSHVRARWQLGCRVPEDGGVLARLSATRQL